MADAVREWYGHDVLYKDPRGIVHVCDGAVAAQGSREFLLWTRCGKMDVPANRGHKANGEPITCPECHKKLESKDG